MVDEMSVKHSGIGDDPRDLRPNCWLPCKAPEYAGMWYRTYLSPTSLTNAVMRGKARQLHDSPPPDKQLTKETVVASETARNIENGAVKTAPAPSGEASAKQPKGA